MKCFHRPVALSFVLLLFLFSATIVKAEGVNKQQVKQKLSIIFGGIDANKINLIDSELKDFYIMQYAGDYGLVSKDGKHYLSGDAWNLDARKNLTEDLRKSYNINSLEKISADMPVSFKAKNEKGFVWVFTDIDCFYCRKLHSEITALNDLGVTVHYLSFPRSGSDQQVDWQKAIDVWCSKDQLSAMTASKQGKSVSGTAKVSNCSPEIAQQYEAGRSIGVRGTPAIVLANGRLISGYMPAERLAQEAISNQ